MPERRLLERADVLARCAPVAPPGRGTTRERFALLAAEGRADLARVKLVESHLDALAVLADLDTEADVADGLWAVWAAEPPHAVLASTAGERPRLSGTKAFCSGASLVDHALVTVPDDRGGRLFAVDVAAARETGQVVVGPDGWGAGGMARSGTRTLTFADVPARAVGAPGAYTARAGFWHGAAGVAACWHGGTLAVADLLLDRSRRRPGDVLLHRQLGSAVTDVRATAALVQTVAGEIDASPDDPDGARLRAEALRAHAVRAATGVSAVVRASLGPGPLVFDADARAVVEDLAGFVLQHHGDRDLVELGRLAAATDAPW